MCEKCDQDFEASMNDPVKRKTAEALQRKIVESIREAHPFTEASLARLSGRLVGDALEGFGASAQSQLPGIGMIVQMAAKQVGESFKRLMNDLSGKLEKGEPIESPTLQNIVTMPGRASAMVH
jgi:hypothetical protein